MRDHNKAFCRLVAETFDCPGPVYEFGSYQVEGQDDYADLRGLFPGQGLRRLRHAAGPGGRPRRGRHGDQPARRVGRARCSASRRSSTSSRSAGRSTRSSGSSSRAALFVITSPLNFRIHGYPDDYWRMTPNCLRRLMAPYAARVAGYQGYHCVPALGDGRWGSRPPSPADCPRSERRSWSPAISDWLRETEASLPIGAEAPRGLVASSIAPRASGTRSPTTTAAEFTIDRRSMRPLAQAG